MRAKSAPDLLGAVPRRAGLVCSGNSVKCHVDSTGDGAEGEAMGWNWVAIEALAAIAGVVGLIVSVIFLI